MQVPAPENLQLHQRSLFFTGWGSNGVGTAVTILTHPLIEHGDCTALTILQPSNETHLPKPQTLQTSSCDFFPTPRKCWCLQLVEILIEMCDWPPTVNPLFLLLSLTLPSIFCTPNSWLKPPYKQLLYLTCSLLVVLSHVTLKRVLSAQEARTTRFIHTLVACLCLSLFHCRCS